MEKMSRICRLMSIAFALIFVNCTNAEEAAAAPSGSGDSEPEVPVLPETVKILAIGNSFSADAVEQELYGLFEAVGQKVVIGNISADVLWKLMLRMPHRMRRLTVIVRLWMAL